MLTRMNHIVPTVLALVLFPLSGFAQEGRSEEMVTPTVRPWDEGGFKPHVGVGAGYLDARDDVSTQDASFMVDAGFQIRPIELSGQFQYTPGSIQVGGRKAANFNVTDILLKAALVVGGDVPLLRDMYVGAKSGAVLNTLEDETTTYFAIGPTAGFDLPLDSANTISIGAEGTYLALIRDNVPNHVSVLGSMKYWF